MNLITAALVSQAGRPVSFRPVGSSMRPLIHSGDLVDVAPVIPARLDKGDIVLVRVAGQVYLHLVVATDHANQRVQIGNNRSRTNGWATYAKVYAIAVSVNGVPRPRTEGKTQPAQS